MSRPILSAVRLDSDLFCQIEAPPWFEPMRRKKNHQLERRGPGWPYSVL